MVDLERVISGGATAAVPMVIKNQKVWIPAVVLIDPAGRPTTAAVELDTDGSPVPTYKAHAFTYDGSGNLSTDTVTDGQTSWVRTYQWQNGAQTSDSGWVKQNG